MAIAKPCPDCGSFCGSLRGRCKDCGRPRPCRTCGALGPKYTNGQCIPCVSVRPCPKCGQCKRFDSGACEPCHRAHREQEHVKDRNKKRLLDPVKRARAMALKRAGLYGLTPEDVQRMLEAQDGKCPCGRTLQPGRQQHIDHNHETGDIRAILCRECNIVIGLLDEDPERLELLAKYLRDHEHATLHLTQRGTAIRIIQGGKAG